MAKAPTHIIPVFLPNAGCQNRCIFCSQETATGISSGVCSPEEARIQIEQGLSFCRRQEKEIEIAFYGANFLGTAASLVSAHLKLAGQFIAQGRAHSIRFSTRPDTVTEETMALLSGFPVSVIELGAQSMDDVVLAAVNRGHKAQDTIRAAVTVKASGISLGLHLMAGLPKETRGSFLSSVRAISDLTPDFVRVHPCLVLAKSPLAQDFLSGAYAPILLSDAVSWVADAFMIFLSMNIPVARMGLLLPPGANPGEIVLAGPYHPAFGELVMSEVLLRRARQVLENRPAGTSATLIVHPKSLSRMKGHRRQNIAALCREFGLSDVSIKTDPGMDMFSVMLACGTPANSSIVAKRIRKPCS